jgi:cytidylate kinase
MKIKNPNIRLILDSHVQDWFLKEKERQERRKIPLIVISRIRGAGGLLVAEVLSRRLGWPYYDKNMIREIAALAGTAEQTVDFLDERDRNTFQEFANIFSQAPEVSQQDYVDHLTRFVHTLAKTGQSILVGRGANFMVTSRDALRVRLIAEFERCLQLAAEEYGMDRKEASELLPKWNREQEAFVKRYFGHDINDPRHYDIVINMTHITVEGAADLIVSTYKQRFPNVL